MDFRSGELFSTERFGINHSENGLDLNLNEQAKVETRTGSKKMMSLHRC